MASRRITLSLALLWMFAAGQMAAQSPAALPADVAAASAGWTALAAGDVNGASAMASAALARYPNSLAVGALLIPVQTLRGGSAAGLSAYEQWLGARSTDEPYLFRLVALSLLREAVHAPGGAPQQQAFQALLAEGDNATLAAVGQTAAAGNPLGLEALGALGNETAVQNLISALKNNPADRSRPIGALVATKSPLAVPPLIQILSDPVPTNRMAAADALGQLEATDAAEPLRGLLKDQQSAVRFAAAGALFRLHDSAGVAFMEDAANSPFPLLRVQALEAMASDPRPAWLDAVRRALTDPDPQVRLIAARLMAPHDAAAATAAIQGLLNDGNIAIVEGATRLYAQQVASDFPSLRHLMHDSDSLIRVNAAARVLELTR